MARKRVGKKRGLKMGGQIRKARSKHQMGNKKIISAMRGK